MRLRRPTMLKRSPSMSCCFSLLSIVCVKRKTSEFAFQILFGFLKIGSGEKIRNETAAPSTQCSKIAHASPVTIAYVTLHNAAVSPAET